MAVDLRAPPGPTTLTRPTGTTRSTDPPGRADSAVVTGTRGMTDRWPCPHGMDAPVLARHSPLHNFLYFPPPPTAPTITGPRGDGENPGPVPPETGERVLPRPVASRIERTPEGRSTPTPGRSLGARPCDGPRGGRQLRSPLPVAPSGTASAPAVCAGPQAAPISLRACRR